MSIALFVEGPSDKDTLTILAKRLAPDLRIVTRVLGRGDLLNAEKVSIFVEQDLMMQHRDVRKVLLCVDSECTPESEWEKITKPAERRLRQLIHNPTVFYCGVIHATEAWLASDSAAISRYLGGEVKHSTVRSVARACKPKDSLAHLFNRSKREFINTRDNPKLAANVEIQELLRTSRSFAYFADQIRTR